MSVPRFATLLPSLAQQPKRGTFFRSIQFEYVSEPLSAVGSIRKGGRYNRRSRFEALYLADSQVTTLYETNAVLDVGGQPIGQRQPPRVMLSIDVELQNVVDLCDPAAHNTLNVTLAELLAPWRLAQKMGRRIITQQIGEAARAIDIEGLWVPSARFAPGRNLVVFPDRLRAGSSIAIFAAGLPDLEVRLNGTYRSSLP